MVQQVWASRVVDYIRKNNCFVIDLRSKEDFEKGHLPKAVSITVDEIEQGLFQVSKKLPIVVYCASGGDSLKIARLLSMRGYMVYNLAGGYDAYKRNQQNGY